MSNPGTPIPILPTSTLQAIQSLTAELHYLTNCACGRPSTDRLYCQSCERHSCSTCRCCHGARPLHDTAAVATAVRNLACAAETITATPRVFARLRIKPESLPANSRDATPVSPASTSPLMRHLPSNPPIFLTLPTRPPSSSDEGSQERQERHLQHHKLSPPPLDLNQKPQHPQSKRTEARQSSPSKSIEEPKTTKPNQQMTAVVPLRLALKPPRKRRRFPTPSSVQIDTPPEPSPPAMTPRKSARCRRPSSKLRDVTPSRNNGSTPTTKSPNSPPNINPMRPCIPGPIPTKDDPSSENPAKSNSLAPSFPPPVLTASSPAILSRTTAGMGTMDTDGPPKLSTNLSAEVPVHNQSPCPPRSTAATASPAQMSPAGAPIRASTCPPDDMSPLAKRRRIDCAHFTEDAPVCPRRRVRAVAKRPRLDEEKSQTPSSPGCETLHDQQKQRQKLGKAPWKEDLGSEEQFITPLKNGLVKGDVSPASVMKDSQPHNSFEESETFTGSNRESASGGLSSSTPASVRRKLEPAAGSFDEGVPDSQDNDDNADEDPLDDSQQDVMQGSAVCIPETPCKTPGRIGDSAEKLRQSARRRSMRNITLPIPAEQPVPKSNRKPPLANTRRRLSLGSSPVLGSDSQARDVDLGPMPDVKAKFLQKSQPSQGSIGVSQLTRKTHTELQARGTGLVGTDVLIPETPEKQSLQKVDQKKGQTEKEIPRRFSDETTESPPNVLKSIKPEEVPSRVLENNSASKPVPFTEERSTVEPSNALLIPIESSERAELAEMKACPEVEDSKLTVGRTIRKERRTGTQKVKNDSKSCPSSNKEHTEKESHFKGLPADGGEGQGVLRDISNSNNLTDDDVGTSSKGLKQDEATSKRGSGCSEKQQSKKCVLGRTTTPSSPLKRATTKKKRSKRTKKAIQQKVIKGMVVCISEDDTDDTHTELAFELITQLGGEVVPDFSDGAPHCVVTRTDENGDLPAIPGAGVHFGAAARVAVVSTKWVVDSFRRGRWASVDAYRLPLAVPAKGVFDGVRATFDTGFMCEDPSGEVQREATELRAMLELGGAVVDEGSGGETVAGSVKKAKKFVVVMPDEMVEHGNVRRVAGVHEVSACWVRESVLRGKADWTPV